MMASDTLDASEAAQRRQMRRVILALVAIVAVVAAAVFAFWPAAALAPPLPVTDVVAVELELIPTSAGQYGVVQKYERASAFNDFIALLGTGRATSDHRCPDTGHVIVNLRDGSQRHYGLLSGHDYDHYEFRLYDGLEYRIYRISRPLLIEALAKMGVERVDEAGPEH